MTVRLMSRNSLSSGAALWMAFYGVILVSWIALIFMSRTSDFSDLPTNLPGFWESFCISAAEAHFGSLFLMWALMSSAMMLPGFVPMLRTYLDLSATGATDNRGAVALVGGYLGVWLVGAGGGAIAQAQLAQASLVSPIGTSISGWLTAALLGLAGIYQLSRLKEACLSKCRMPLSYFMERWRPGDLRAFTMGLELGAICFGCCWALMALAFVGGTMSVLWMATMTVLMSLEKVPELGRPVTRPLGYTLLLASALSVALAATN